MSVYLMFLVVLMLIVTRTSFYILLTYTGKISTHLEEKKNSQPLDAAFKKKLVTLYTA